MNSFTLRTLLAELGEELLAPLTHRLAGYGITQVAEDEAFATDSPTQN